MASSRKAKLIIVSDSRGDTALQLVTAAAVQFESEDYSIIRKSEVRTPERVAEIVAKAGASRAVVFYTLVGEDTRRAMREASAEHLVTTVDLLGPAFRALHDLFETERHATPGLLYALDSQRFDRMEAIDFTLKHDDGQRPHDLSRADVVLVGVSRASKSSTCFYLAYAGVRAANVPLIPGIPPPTQLHKLPRSRVIGLRANVHRLMTVREARARNLGIGTDDFYVDKREVAREVLSANRMMDDHGWRSIDVSYMAIEEIAGEVMRLRGLKGPRSW